MHAIVLYIESHLKDEDKQLVLKDKEWFKKLQQQVDELLRKDFPALVQVLYQCDISEQKLKRLLKENADQPAAYIIAALLVERHAKKLEVRKQFSGNHVADSDEERW